MNGKKIMFLMAGCLLLFSGCGQNGTGDAGIATTGAQLPEGETTATEWQLPAETEQKLTETELTVRKSLVQIQAGDLLGSGVIYDEDEKSLLIATAGHVLTHTNGEILVTFPDGTQVTAT